MKRKITAMLLVLAAVFALTAGMALASETSSDDSITTNATVIKAIQDALTAKGYDCGTADGNVGPNTYKQMFLYMIDELEIDLEKLGVNIDTSKYQSYSYDTLARYPDEYTGKYVTITGQVLQVIEDDTITGYRISTSKASYGYTSDEVFMVIGTTPEVRILEDDIVTVYGMSMGLYSYETVMGATLSIPEILFETITIN